MNITMRFKFGALLPVLTLALAPSLFGQSFSLGTDIVSRYIWRGTDFGESASFQLTLAFSAGGLEISTWAS